MSSSVLIWIAVGVLLFWAVGAYNRLVRLRAEANTAFAVLDTEFTRQVQLVEACLPQDPQSAVLEEESAFWGSLQGASSQFAASLSAARQRPLDMDRIAALSAAQDVLAMAWSRAERDDAHDLAGSRLPETVSVTRTQLVTQAQSATELFNAAVVRYNDAIAQFPAVLLAWLFGFKSGRAMAARRQT